MRSLACLLLLALTSTAYADGGDDRERCVQADNQTPVKLHKEHRDGRDVWVVEMKICGHAPAPGVAFVPVSKSINYEWETLRQVFLPATVHSVEKGPF